MKNVSFALAGVLASLMASMACAQQTPGVFYNFRVLSVSQNYQPSITVTEPRATSTCDPVSRTCTGQITAPPGFAFMPNAISPFGLQVADPSGREEVLNFDGQMLLDQGIAFWTLTYGGFAGNLCSQVQCLAENGLPQTAATINWPLVNGGTYTDYITFAQFSTLLARPYPVPVSAGLTLRLKVTAPLELPGRVPAGAPIEATLGFLDTNGNPIVPHQAVTLNPGQSAWLDLNPDAILIGPLKIVVPVVGPPPGATSVAPLEATLELFDAHHRGSVLAIHPPEPAEPVPAPSFGPQGLASGQTIALLVSALPPGIPAHPPQPCIATLSFADKDGNPIGPSMRFNLSPGQVKALTMEFPTPEVPPGPTNATERIEVQPIVTLAPAVPGPAPVISECLASAVVYESHTGHTLTYQSGDADHR